VRRSAQFENIIMIDEGKNHFQSMKAHVFSKKSYPIINITMQI